MFYVNTPFGELPVFLTLKNHFYSPFSDTAVYPIINEDFVKLHSFPSTKYQIAKYHDPDRVVYEYIFK